MILASSLKSVGTTKKIVCMVTDAVTEPLMAGLEQIFDEIVPVNVMDSKDQENLKLLSRPELGVTFTKLHCWRLTQYTKCVFMDADTLALENIDDLFQREELSAAPDVGWPDCFNSGVFVFVPSMETYHALVHLALTEGSFDGADQGLLNMYFSDWATKGLSVHLPFTDNCVYQTFYSCPPALKQFGSRVRVVHFIGSAKPWRDRFNTKASTLQSGAKAEDHCTRYLNLWWHHFNEGVRPILKCIDSGQLDLLADLEVEDKLALGTSQGQGPPGKSLEKWERGEIDYTGCDRFSKIQEKLNKCLRQ